MELDGRDDAAPDSVLEVFHEEDHSPSGHDGEGIGVEAAAIVGQVVPGCAGQEGWFVEDVGALDPAPTDAPKGARCVTLPLKRDPCG